jgi:hypothetical protein
MTALEAYRTEQSRELQKAFELARARGEARRNRLAFEMASWWAFAATIAAIWGWLR